MIMNYTLFTRTFNIDHIEITPYYRVMTYYGTNNQDTYYSNDINDILQHCQITLNTSTNTITSITNYQYHLLEYYQLVAVSDSGVKKDVINFNNTRVDCNATTSLSVNTANYDVNFNATFLDVNGSRPDSDCRMVGGNTIPQSGTYNVYWESSLGKTMRVYYHSSSHTTDYVDASLVYLSNGTKYNGMSPNSKLTMSTTFNTIKINNVSYPIQLIDDLSNI